MWQCDDAQKLASAWWLAPSEKYQVQEEYTNRRQSGVYLGVYPDTWSAKKRPPSMSSRDYGYDRRDRDRDYDRRDSRRDYDDRRDYRRDYDDRRDSRRDYDDRRDSRRDYDDRDSRRY